MNRKWGTCWKNLEVRKNHVERIEEFLTTNFPTWKFPSPRFGIRYNLGYVLLVRAVGKSEVGRFLFKLERAKRSWKEPNEVGKTEGSWKVSFEVGKSFDYFVESFQVQFKLSNFSCTFQLQLYFPTSVVLSNFRSNLPTSARTFQLRRELSNFGRNFPISFQTFQLKTFQLFVLSDYPFQRHVSPYARK